jgi:hypothetical protein
MENPTETRVNNIITEETIGIMKSMPIYDNIVYYDVEHNYITLSPYIEDYSGQEYELED